MSESGPSTSAPALDAELEELQRRYRMMEGDRKSYADEVANVVRKQKAQIEKQKRENSQLKNELSLQARSAAMGESGIVSTHITKLQDTIDAITRQVEAEKRRGEEHTGEAVEIIINHKSWMVHIPHETDTSRTKCPYVRNATAAHHERTWEEPDNMKMYMRCAACFGGNLRITLPPRDDVDDDDNDSEGNGANDSSSDDSDSASDTSL